MVLELLMADQPQAEDAHDRRSRFLAWAKAMDVGCRASLRDDSPRPDLSHPAMAVNLDACIHCNLCVRACREVQVNDVIGMAFRGPHTRSCSTSTIRWAVDLRRLRGMRAGLSDGRADAEDDRR